MSEAKSIVNVNVRKHTVSIEDELIVKIRHNKDCPKNCPEIESIVTYLDDELFLAEGFVVTNEK